MAKNSGPVRTVHARTTGKERDEMIATTKAEIEKATRTGDYAKAGELQYGKLPTLQKQLEEEEKLAEAKKESSLLRDRVTEEEIANRLKQWQRPAPKFTKGYLGLYCKLASSGSKGAVMNYDKL